MLMRMALLVLVSGLILLVILVWRLDNRDGREYRLLSQVWSPVWRTPTDVDTPGAPISLTGQSFLDTLEWMGLDAATLDQQGDQAVLKSTQESVWWMNRRGPFGHIQVTGDFALEGHASVRALDDASMPPDREWQFAGLMLRDPRGDRRLSLENYVFVVVGHRGDRLQIEFKSTVDGQSDVHAVDWDSGDAELRVHRAGSDVTVSVRETGARAWNDLATFRRPDISDSAQVGPVMYSFSYGRGYHGLVATFSELALLATDDM